MTDRTRDEVEGSFTEEGGILVPRRRPVHREDEYDELGFDLLVRMQRAHFWYRGRHRLLLNVLRQEARGMLGRTRGLRAIDLGGGCGGWLEYLRRHEPEAFGTLALGDSSLRALTMAEPVVGDFAPRYHIDLLDLPWEREWDIVFLLDVLEHIPDHVEVLRQVRRALRPGGLLFVTAPALEIFWTHNDTLARHQRRYARRDFPVLAREAGLRLRRTAYFMFSLSPALLLYRTLVCPPPGASPAQLVEYARRSHRVPARPVNALLTGVLLVEASLVNRVSFPWGTSVLAVLQRPE